MAEALFYTPIIRRPSVLEWFPSKTDCLEINAACNHFWAKRGLTFLSETNLPVPVLAEPKQSDLSESGEARESTPKAGAIGSPDSTSVISCVGQTHLPCAESTSREAGRRSPGSSSVDAHGSARGFLSVN
jgi:hypothetical protein